MVTRRMFRALLLAGATLSTQPLGLANPANAADAPQNVDWPAYNNDMLGQRYSPLKQVNAGNVASLQEVCRVKIQDGGSFHTGPIVVEGTMYVTTARDTVALDPHTCKEMWRNTYRSSIEDVWPVNRGVAYSNGRLFRGTPNGRLLAIDAKTGKQIWEDVVGDPARGEFLSGSPVAWNGVVYTGTAGGDWGNRGRVVAFNAEDGRELWRFNLIPAPNEPGADTWQVKKSALTGGGGTWTTLTLDVTTNELIVPVGNPAPDLNAEYRPGDNLYTDSVVVLDARTGALKWYHQLKAHDGVDHDIAAAPTLYRSPEMQDVMAIGGKDGYVVGVDRETRKVLYRTAVTSVDNEAAIPTEAGVHVCPGLLGGVEWNGAAFDLPRNSLYIGAVDWCAVFKKGGSKWVAGELFYGGDPIQDPVDQASGWVTAINASNGAVKWQYHAAAPVVGGITPTAGNVVFGGDTKGTFFALDSNTGKPLLSMPTSGMIAGGVVTYAVEGKQYVAFTSGNVSRLTFGNLGDPTIVVLGLNGSK